MKNFFALLLLFMIISCSNRNIKSQEDIVSNNIEVIKLKPDNSNKIYLSTIVDDIKIIPLETSDESLIGDIAKIEFDESYFILNNLDKFVYLFDKQGKFKGKFGRSGRARDEIVSSKCFALNRKSHEVWFVDNYNSLKRYDYNGKYINSENINMFCNDIYISNSGSIYFYTSKKHNYDQNGEVVNSNLIVMTKDRERVSYFDYDPEIHYNGCLSFDTKLQFNNYNNRAAFTYSYDDTIYSISGDSIRADYYIDLNNDKFDSQSLNKVTGEEFLDIIQQNKDKAFFVHNFIETTDFIRFNYVMKTQLYDVFYNKRTKQHVEGVLINDILGGSLNIISQNGDNIIAYMQIDDIDYDNIDRLSPFDKDIIHKLSKLDSDDNPILLEIRLRFNS